MEDDPKVNVEASRIIAEALHQADLRKNWDRLCITINGFRAKHKSWPKRVRLINPLYNSLRKRLLSEEAFSQLQEKVELIPVAEDSGEAALIAEDDEGNRFLYGKDGWGWTSDKSAEEWLGVWPDRLDSDS